MSKALNLKDRLFERLTVVKDSGNRSSEGCIIWDCICKCGNYTSAKTTDLISGHKRSCGCLQKEIVAEIGRLSKKQPYEFLYLELIRRARNSQKDVNFTFEEFLEYTKISSCFYCGKELIWTKHSCLNGVETRSCATNLDRKNSKLGYSKENCVVCCPDCNRGKSDCFSFDEWIVMAAALKRYRRQCDKTRKH